MGTNSAAAASSCDAQRGEKCNANGNVFDVCGVCAGTGITCLGCDGVANSKKVNDACGICGGNNSTCVGYSPCRPLGCLRRFHQTFLILTANELLIHRCDGVLGSGKKIDACNVCGGNSTACADCAGVANGKSVIDSCGVCGGTGSTCYCNADATKECSGNGKCDASKKCACIPGRSYDDCSRISSKVFSFAIGGQYLETFDAVSRTAFVTGLASALKIETGAIYIVAIRGGSVIVDIAFTQTDTCSNCQTIGVNALNNLIAGQTSTSAPLRNIGVTSVTVDGTRTNVYGLELTCDVGSCKKTLPVKGIDYVERTGKSDALFSPKLAGNYTFSVSVTDRCQTLTQLVRVQAVCTHDPPVASFVLSAA